MEIGLGEGIGEKTRTEILYNHVFFAPNIQIPNPQIPIQMPKFQLKIESWNSIMFALTKSIISFTILFSIIAFNISISYGFYSECQEAVNDRLSESFIKQEKCRMEFMNNCQGSVKPVLREFCFEREKCMEHLSTSTITSSIVLQVLARNFTVYINQLGIFTITSILLFGFFLFQISSLLTRISRK